VRWVRTFLQTVAFFAGGAAVVDLILWEPSSSLLSLAILSVVCVSALLLSFSFPKSERESFVTRQLAEEVYAENLQVDEFETKHGTVAVTWFPGQITETMAAKLRSMMGGEKAAPLNVSVVRERIRIGIRHTSDLDWFREHAEEVVGAQILLIQRASEPKTGSLKELAAKAAEEDAELQALLTDQKIPERIKRKLRNLPTSLDKALDE
jgi:hypothetical protein